MAEKQFQIKVDITADQMQASARKVVASLEEVNAATKEGGKQAVVAAEKSVKFADSLKQMGNAARGAAMAIPGVGQVAALMANPLTAAIGAITAGFMLLRSRIEAVKSALTNFQPADLARWNSGVSQSEKAWVAYGKAVQGVLDSYTSLDAKQAARLKGIKDEADALRARMAVEKQVEMSRPDADKAEIEARYGAAGLKISGDERAKTILEKAAMVEELRQSSQKKLKAAEEIRVGTPEQDAARAAAIAGDDPKIAAEIEERTKRKLDFEAIRDGWRQGANGLVMPTGAGIAAYARQYKFMTPGLSQGDLTGLAEQEQTQIDALVARRQGGAKWVRETMPIRAGDRERKMRLSGEAGKESALADKLESELPGDRAAAGQADNLQAYQLKGEAVVRAGEALKSTGDEAARLLNQIVAAQGAADAAALKAYREMLSRQQQQEAALNQLRGEMDNMRNQK